MLWIQLPPKARCTTLCDKVSDLRQVDCFLRVLRFPPPIILLKVTLNTIKPTIQTTKNYSVNWNGNHQKRDEIDTNSHSFFFIYKILNGCNGLRPAQLAHYVFTTLQFGCCLLRSLSYVNITLPQRILDT